MDTCLQKLTKEEGKKKLKEAFPMRKYNLELICIKRVVQLFVTDT